MPHDRGPCRPPRCGHDADEAKPQPTLDDIPRRGGRFFWSQVVAAKRAGAEMLYVAMFDEVDGGTTIFKCTNDPPTGNGAAFVTYEGLPSDHSLRLTGRAGAVIRGALPPDDEPPVPAGTRRQAPATGPDGGRPTTVP